MADAMVQRRKGPERPINTATDRIEVIDGVEGVDYSFLLPERVLGLAGAIMRLHPDVYVEHSEYGLSRWRALFLGALGIKYTIDCGDKIDSTTDIIKRLGLQKAGVKQPQV